MTDQPKKDRRPGQELPAGPDGTRSAKLERRRNMNWDHLIEDQPDPIEAGAQAVMTAFPTLREDFTDDGFRKVARIVLEAGK